MVKNLPAKEGDADVGLITGSGRSPVVGNGSPLLYSCQENSMDRGAGRATVQVAKSWTQPCKCAAGNDFQTYGLPYFSVPWRGTRHKHRWEELLTV